MSDETEEPRILRQAHCYRCGADGGYIEYGEIVVTKPGARGYCPHYWEGPTYAHSSLSIGCGAPS